MKNNTWKIVLVFGLVTLLISTSTVPSISSIVGKDHPVSFDEGLVGYWNFNEGTGIIVHDSSGNGNDGGIVGDTQWVNGVEGTGLLLNGDDIVAIPDNSVLNPSQITLCCWVKLNRLAYGNGWQSNQSQMMICKGGDRTPGAYLLCQGGSDPSNLFVALLIGEYWNGNAVLGYFPFETDHWYFVAGTYDGNIMKIYLNGVLLASKEVGNISVGNGSPLYFSYNDVSGYPYFLDGVLDEERVYNKALSEEEIWLLYSQPQNVPPNKPSKPSGSAKGKINIEYTYTSSTADVNGDQIYYWFDWGDGANSGWIGPYASGATASAKHKWSVKGTYQIKVKAKDIYGAESNWSDPLPVSMPRTISFNSLFLKLLERFPHAFPILRKLLVHYEIVV
jgi:hypothetical protein